MKKTVFMVFALLILLMAAVPASADPEETEVTIRVETRDEDDNPAGGAQFMAYPVETDESVFTECEPDSPYYGLAVAVTDDQAFDTRYIENACYSVEDPDNSGCYEIQILNPSEGWYAVHEIAAPDGFIYNDDLHFQNELIRMVYIDPEECLETDVGIQWIGTVNHGNPCWPDSDEWAEPLVFWHTRTEEEPEETSFFNEYIADDPSFLSYMESDAFEDVQTEIGQTDFATMGLLVVGDIVDPEHESGSYGDVHIMSYDTEEDARWAFAYYDLYNENVVPDGIVSLCDLPVIPDDMDFPNDPVSETDRDDDDIDWSGMRASIFQNLHHYLDEEPVPTQHYDIALIDTPTYTTLDSVDFMTFSDLTLKKGPRYSDSGLHGELMYQTILGENSNASVFSIAALYPYVTSSGKVSDFATISSLYASIIYASHLNIDIMNLSLRMETSTRAEDLLARALNQSLQSGIMVFAAAGNDACDADLKAPACLDECVITVGACAPNGKPACFSNFGDSVDYYVRQNSTSEATATLSGIYSLQHQITVDETTVFPGTFEENEEPIAITDQNFIVSDLYYNTYDDTFRIEPVFQDGNSPDLKMLQAGDCHSALNAHDFVITSIFQGAHCYYVSVEGIGNYSGSIRFSVPENHYITINKSFMSGGYYLTSGVDTVLSEIDLSGSEISVTGIEDLQYTGQLLTQDITVTYTPEWDTEHEFTYDLTEEDYELSYQNNRNAGTAALTITGQGCFTGTISRTFQITPVDLQDVTIYGLDDHEYYSFQGYNELLMYGNRPLNEGSDYTINAVNSDYPDLQFPYTRIGHMQVTLTGMGNYTGSVVRDYIVSQRQMENLEMSVLI